MNAGKVNDGPPWTKEEDQIFENAIAMYHADDNLFLKITTLLPRRSLEEITHHYQILVDDIEAIEAGKVPLPRYPPMRRKPRRQSKPDPEQRKGFAWSEEEHRAFLMGLATYGKGDWRSISRQCVQSRSPSQVASHAQKYYNRQEALDKDKKRTSINDITLQTPITCQVTNLDNMVAPAEGTSQVVSMVGAVDSQVASSDVVAAPEDTNNSAQERPYPGASDDLKLDLDELIMELEEVPFEDMFILNTGKPLSPSKQPSASADYEMHPFPRIGSELEALMADHMVEDTELSSIFDCGKSQPSPSCYAVTDTGIGSACGKTLSASQGGLTLNSGNLQAITPLTSPSLVGPGGGLTVNSGLLPAVAPLYGSVFAAPRRSLSVNSRQLPAIGPSSGPTFVAPGGGFAVNSGKLQAIAPSSGSSFPAPRGRFTVKYEQSPAIGPLSGRTFSASRGGFTVNSGQLPWNTIAPSSGHGFSAPRGGVTANSGQLPAIAPTSADSFSAPGGGVTVNSEQSPTIAASPGSSFGASGEGFNVNSGQLPTIAPSYGPAPGGGFTVKSGESPWNTVAPLSGSSFATPGEGFTAKSGQLPATAPSSAPIFAAVGGGFSVNSGQSPAIPPSCGPSFGVWPTSNTSITDEDLIELLKEPADDLSWC